MTHVPPVGAILRAIAIRELRPPALASVVVPFVVAGAAAALIASRLSAAPTGMANMIAHFDQTLAGVASIIAVMRTINRITTDACDDWMLQLVAAGGSRELYVCAVILSVSALLFVATIAGGFAFGGVTLLQMHHADALFRVLQDVLLLPLLLVSSASFGAAIACVMNAAAAGRIAVILMIAPWIAIALAVAAQGRLDTVFGYIDVLGYFPPRLFMQMSVGYVAYAFVYTGAALAIVLFVADRRIGRRT